MQLHRLLILAGLMVVFCAPSASAATSTTVYVEMGDRFLALNWLLTGVALGFLIYNLCLAFFTRETVFLLNGLVLLTGMIILVNRETPQLCWGGTQSLTITGVS